MKGIHLVRLCQSYPNHHIAYVSLGTRFWLRRSSVSPRVGVSRTLSNFINLFRNLSTSSLSTRRTISSASSYSPALPLETTHNLYPTRCCQSPVTRSAVFFSHRRALHYWVQLTWLKNDFEESIVSVKASCGCAGRGGGSSRL